MNDWAALCWFCCLIGKETVSKLGLVGVSVAIVLGSEVNELRENLGNRAFRRSARVWI